jgi:hypothetical protein
MNNQYDREEEQIEYTFNVNTSGMIEIESKSIPTTETIINNAAEKAAKILNVDITNIDKIKFLRLYLALYSLCGYNKENQSEGDNMMRWWLNTDNKHLGYVPANYLQHPIQMDEIIRYLESFNNH